MNAPHNKKILITGGAGYIGSHIAVELLERGIAVVIFDALLSDASRRRAEILVSAYSSLCTLVEGDLCVADDVESAFQGHSFHGVIHCAALKSPAESVLYPGRYYANNVGSTEVLLEVMRAHGVDILIFSSSCSIHGSLSCENVSEDSPVGEALSPYSLTKSVCEERIVSACAHDTGLRAMIMRYFNPVGTSRDLDLRDVQEGDHPTLLAALMRAAVGRLPVRVFGGAYPTRDGTCVRDYVHVADVAEAHVRALEYAEKNPPGVSVFNVGRGEGVTVLELVRLFEEVLGRDIAVTFEPPRESDVVTSYANTSRAERLMGWKARHSLRDALSSVWSWRGRIPGEP